MQTEQTIEALQHTVLLIIILWLIASSRVECARINPLAKIRIGNPLLACFDFAYVQTTRYLSIGASLCMLLVDVFKFGQDYSDFETIDDADAGHNVEFFTSQKHLSEQIGFVTLYRFCLVRWTHVKYSTTKSQKRTSRIVGCELAIILPTRG